jgi:hypothetical protein
MRNRYTIEISDPGNAIRDRVEAIRTKHHLDSNADLITYLLDHASKESPMQKLTVTVVIPALSDDREVHTEDKEIRDLGELESIAQQMRERYGRWARITMVLAPIEEE